VLDELLQHRGQMEWSGDQEVIEALAAQGPDEAFGDRVGPRCPYRVRMMRMSAPVNTASANSLLSALKTARTAC
jgi:hypothetical protein